MDEKIWTSLEVTENDAGKRLDVLVASSMEGVSRSYIQKLIKEGNVLIHQKPQKANYRITGTENDLQICIPKPEELTIEPAELPLDILYEDEDVIVLNKEKGRVVHPAPGHWNDTLVNGLMFHCRDQLSGINGVMRPGIVHRIDKDTSGVLVICKNDIAHRDIAEQLKEHTITRKYEAIVWNRLKEETGTIDAPLNRHPVERKKRVVDYRGGKRAVTHYKVLEHLADNLDYIECQLETGRTHQIRVHMASISHPLLGDEVYGKSKTTYGACGQVLHAKTLGFIHPTTKKYMEFTAELPDYFQQILTKLRR